MVFRGVFAFLLLLGTPGLVPAQSLGTIRGVVRLEGQDLPLHHARILVVQLGRSVETVDDGTYEIQDVPAGTFDVVVSMPGLGTAQQEVTVSNGSSATADFALRLSPLREEITVTASGVEQTVFEAFQAVSTLDSFQLAEKGATSIGEVLDGQPGVAKRSFGPGSSRPVIRGFDGDRVLVLQDGVRTGSLASQSGDHGEPIDALNIDRLEVVKGPATLLYGSNAVGGVVNAVSSRHQLREGSVEGMRGYMNLGTGSTNRYGGGSLGFDYGVRNWLVWGGAGNQKTGDYKTAVGKVLNSGSRLSTGTAGLGWYGSRSFGAVSYGYDDGIYGIPLEDDDSEVIKLDFLRRNVRLSAGARSLSSFIDGVRADFNYSGWRHRELDFEGDEVHVGTLFNNKQYTYQVALDQKRHGRFSGTLGFLGLHRDYESSGEEAIAPPVKQNVAAVFGLEQVKFERFELQFGARLENTRYTPTGAQNRSFTGASAAAGVHWDLWPNGALVANYTHSYRAPALEELYNNGPHPGNLTYEIGNDDLKRERSNGFDFSVRHKAPRLRAEANVFFYGIDDFVYLAPTGDVEDGLNEAKYAQGDTLYNGLELSLDFETARNLWLTGGFDYVRAELRQSGSALPRIPPFRGRLGLDARWGNFSIRPELVLAARQERVFETETETAGYGVVNLTANYTMPRQHSAHHFAFVIFNLGDRVYRNHVSFIKDIAPEIGRGVKLTYSLKFF